MRKILTAALAVAAAATATVATTGTAHASLRWGDCPADAARPGLQCSTLRVPLDYRHPDGRQITLAVSRLSSPHPAKRHGVLLVNQGGPGLTGLSFPATLAGAIPPLKQALPQRVRDSYDIIGFDPRGVGHSTPVTCDLTTAQVGLAMTPTYPQNSADVAQQATFARSVADKCAHADTADLLPYLTTRNTARDMDRIRAALGAPELSYYGASYGTYLGAVYTTLFPDRSDRVVLDSSLGPNGYDRHALRSQALGFQTRFPDFAKLAAAGDDTYHLGSTPAAVTRKYHELAARLDEQPVQGMNGTVFRAVTAEFLRADGLLGTLGTIFHDLDTDQPLPPLGGEEGHGDNVAASYLAVVCGESRWPTSVRTYQRAVAVDRIRYPMYGAETANIRPCAYWPTHAAEPKVRITGRGAASVLMIQNLRDPATPLPLALRMRAALGHRARLVTVDDGGHGVYQYVPNRCANDTVSDFLATGTRPNHDTRCPAEKRS